MPEDRFRLCRSFQQQNVVLMLMADALKPAKDGISVWLALELREQVADNIRCMEALMTPDQFDAAS